MLGVGSDIAGDLLVLSQQSYLNKYASVAFVYGEVSSPNKRTKVVSSRSTRIHFIKTKIFRNIRIAMAQGKTKVKSKLPANAKHKSNKTNKKNSAFQKRKSRN